MNGLKRKLVVMVFLCLILEGCTASDSQKIESEENASETVSETPTVSELPTVKVEEENIEGVTEQPESMDEEPANMSDQVNSIIKIKNPGYDYYTDPSMEAAEPSKAMGLKLVSKEANKITDKDKWLSDNDLLLDQFPYSDNFYTYETEGENNYETYLLSLTNLESGEKITLDFSEFQYGEIYKEEDYDFIKQRISFAKVQDGILYVATSHNTYAESSPQNAYLTAIDLSDYHVLWKTEPLTCNSYTFVIKDQIIVCGYGFTSEKDYLKIVDCKTGSIINETAIDSMAEYIILKENELFVRTYDKNYVFQLTDENL